MMVEFFREWKRKIGCAALALAFLCVYGGIRSAQTTDQLEIAVGNSIHFLTSTQGYFRWTRHAERPIGTIPLVWYSMANGSPGQPLDTDAGIHWQRRSDWYLFDFGQGVLRGSSLGVWTMSYLIGIPLTGVAAALLILTAQKSTQTKMPEPIDVAGT